MATNTAASFTNHTGNGSTNSFAISFPFLSNNEIDVTVGGVLKTITTHYTITGSTLTFTSGNTPANGAAVKFQRDTDISTKKVDFADGSVLTEADLDSNSDQILFGLQEFVDIVTNDLVKRDGSQTFTGSIVFEGSSDDANETTLSVTNPTADRTITFPDVTGTVVTTGDTGTVNSTMITNNTIVDADINSSANINGSKLLNDSVGLTKLGSGALPTDITIASANIVNGTIVNEDIATGTLDGRYFTETELNPSASANQNVLDARYYTETELDAGQLDNRYYTEAEADARFYNLASVEEIQSGETWTSADNKVATTAAIDARVIDLVDDVGGFVPIANETSFPTSNPDINNPATGGTIVSISAASTNLVPSGTTVTIANGRGSGLAVIITGVSSTIPSGFGFLVETTSTDHTYTFHRLVPKATEVTTVAGNTTNINTVATNISNVNAVGTNISNVNSVAGNASNINSAVSNASNINAAVSNATNINSVVSNATNINTVAGISANVTTVANDGTDIGTVAGISSNVTTVAGISGNVTTVAGISSNVTSVAGNSSNINTVAGNNANITTVAGISSNVTTVANDGTDIGLVAGSIANVNTTAGSIANVNTVAGSIANVNTVGTNITNVTNASNYLNNFLQLYLGEASSNPTVDGLGNAITEGDLYFNTVDKRVRVFNGSVFQNIGEGLIEVAKFATAAFNTLYTASAGSNSIDLGGLAVTGAVFSNEAIAANRVSLGKGSGTFNLGGI